MPGRVAKGIGIFSARFYRLIIHPTTSCSVYGISELQIIRYLDILKFSRKC